MPSQAVMSCLPTDWDTNYVQLKIDNFYLFCQEQQTISIAKAGIVCRYLGYFFLFSLKSDAYGIKFELQIQLALHKAIYGLLMVKFGLNVLILIDKFCNERILISAWNCIKTKLLTVHSLFALYAIAIIWHGMMTKMFNNNNCGEFQVSGREQLDQRIITVQIVKHRSYSILVKIWNAVSHFNWINHLNCVLKMVHI